MAAQPDPLLIRLDYIPLCRRNTTVNNPPYACSQRLRSLVSAHAAAGKAAASFPWRAERGAFGRKRMENEVEWRHEAPKLIAAYEMLWRGEAISHTERGVET